MKKTTLFLMFLLLALPIAIAQEEITGDASEATPFVTATVTEPVVTAEVTEPIVTTPVLISAKTNETTEAKEYSWASQAMDRIKLAFAMQEQRKVELMNVIKEKRTAHYNFLVAKGKTEQAAKFQEKTTGLEKNFEQWKTKRAEKLQKMEGKVSKLDNASDKKKAKVEQRTKEVEEKTAKIEQKIKERSEDNESD